MVALKLVSILFLLASACGEARSWQNSIDGELVAHDYAAQARRLQDSPATAKTATSVTATGIANANATVIGFSIYSTSNLPTGALAPPSSCADALMTTVECNSTILLMGYNFPFARSIHDDHPL